MIGEGISGSLNFHQAQEDAPTTIEGTIRGLAPGRHGIHIHVFGDFTDGLNSAGGIFNPFGRNHGSPDEEERMSGDLGHNELL
jgi:Cu-Zn family superoxide dismutase